MFVNTLHHRIRPTIAVGLGFALVLTACGGDDDAGDTTVAATATPSDSNGELTGSDEAVPLAPSSLTLSDQGGDGTTVIVDGIDLPAAGFVAVHADGGGTPGAVIGVSELIPAGSNGAIDITLDEPLGESGTVFPMVHIDTNGNGVYEFGQVDGADGPGTSDAGEIAVGPIEITIDGATGDSTSGDETSGDAESADDAQAGGNTITIADFAFSGVTEVAVGTTIVVTNNDAAPHTWTAEDDTFDSGSLGQGDTFEFTFDTAGEYAYFCNFHPSMTGIITVTG